MKRTKIFIDAMPIASAKMSGIGHYSHEMIKNLASQSNAGDKYQIVLLATAKSMVFVRALNIPGVTYRSIWLPHRVWNRLAGLRFMLPIDLFFGSGLYVFPNYRRWPLLWSKSVTFIYDLSFIYYPEFSTKRSSSFLATNIARWAKHSSAIVTISTNSKAELVKELGVDPAKITIAYPGVDAKLFYRRTEPEIENVKKKYGLPSSFVLYVGNIEPRKNLTRLVQAYSALDELLKTNHPLVLVGGSGWMSAEIDAEIVRARKRGDKIIRPARYIEDADLPAIYSASSVLAHPAIYEGFGISLIQAMACGVPVICGNTSSMPEVVGAAATLVDPEDVGAIAAALGQTLTNLQMSIKMSKNGSDQAAKFNWQGNAQAIHALLRSLSQ